MSDVVVECVDLHRRFVDGGSTIEVLKGVNLQVHRGETVAIIGSSGSGKSTLLHCLGGLDTASAGSVSIDGQQLSDLNSVTLDRMRNHKLGFVYQFHHLLAELSALENVAMPLLIRGFDKQAAIEAAMHWLNAVKMGHRVTHRPGQLSGGERQRVAIARAFAGEPACVMADEPTGNLDAENADRIYRLMLELAIDQQTAFIIVTHDSQIAARMNRIYQLDDGKLAKVRV